MVTGFKSYQNSLNLNNMKLTIIPKIRETCTRFLQPTRSECFPYCMVCRSSILIVHTSAPRVTSESNLDSLL